MDIAINQRGTDQTEWQVNVKNPAPVDVVGDHATHDWAQNRTKQNADGENRHRFAFLLIRINLH